MASREFLAFWSWTALVLLLGIALEQVFFDAPPAAAPVDIETVVRPQREQTTPTVRVDGVRDGMIRGMVRGNVRLAIGGEPVQPADDGTFAMDPNAFLAHIIEETVPAGARFVASIRGANYYAIESSAGRRLVPKNRVYFETRQQAEAAGYEQGNH